MWTVWWLSLLVVVPWVQWPTMSVTASSRLSWGLLGLGACLWSLGQRTPRRSLSLSWWAALLVVLVSCQLTQVMPTIAQTEWTQAWGLVATFGNVVCWWSLFAWVTASVLRYGQPTRWLPYLLCGLLALNLIAYEVQTHHGWTPWLFSESQGGLFPNSRVWGAWCALSLPVVWEWKKLASAPLVLGLWLSHSMSAWCATIISVVPGLAVIPATMGFNHLTGSQSFEVLFAIRLKTWSAILHAIGRFPQGIGWSPVAYSRAMAMHSGLLPHPSSDVLRVILETGWLVIPVLLWAAWASWKQFSGTGLSRSLKAAWVLAFVQTSVSLPQVGILVWILWCHWRMHNADCSDSVRGCGRPLVA